jgi:hypothetical protein
MKLNFRPNNQGGILVLTVCTALIIGLGLVSYLLLVHSKNKLVSRSMHWNLALAHAEAGVEEALAQLNHKFGIDVDRSANGWGAPVGGFHGPVVRNLKTGSYAVSISTDALPVIKSIGYATNPIGGLNAVVSRTVEVKARVDIAFDLGMAAIDNITFNGTKIRIDSYDSTDPAHDDPLDMNEVKDGGDVASIRGFVNVGNATIKGKVYVGPTGDATVGATGSAGSLAWPDKAGTIEPGWLSKDFNREFKDVTAPLGSPSLPTGTSSNYWKLTPGFYATGGSVTPSGNPTSGPGGSANKAQAIVVEGGVVRLWVKGSFDIPKDWAIIIKPGATLKLYVGTETGTGHVGGFGPINLGNDAGAFQYFGLPSNTAVTWGGGNEFKGAVYAPQAEFTLNGQGGDIDYRGSCVVKKVVINGNYMFHYDEALRKKDAFSGFIAGSWREL